MRKNKEIISIIIAAGVSKRLRPLTDDKPKCMLKVNGKPIIQKMIEQFRSNGINDISIIRGYKKEKINFPDVTYFENKDFWNNNILHSLMAAKDKLRDTIKNKTDIIISYSDICLDDSVIKILLKSTETISAVIDIDWDRCYRDRTDHPISEAEKVIMNSSNKMIKIGKHVAIVNAAKENKGEFIGLWKFTSEGAEIFLKYYDRLNSTLKKTDPFQNAKEWQKSYITDIFQEMIDKGENLYCVLIKNNWVEIDTIQDYQRVVCETKIN